MRKTAILSRASNRWLLAASLPLGAVAVYSLCEPQALVSNAQARGILQRDRVVTAAPAQIIVAAEPAVTVLPSDSIRLPTPSAAPPARAKAGLIKVELEAKPVNGLMADGVGFAYWTYNGTVPGPMIRVRQGDDVELTLRNSTDSAVTHSIDSHGVIGPGGGGKVTQTPPGGSSTFKFKAMNPGVFIYHCATPMIPYHLAHGMYGLMVVEPRGGLPKVDKEFYVVQGDFYLDGDPAAPGQHQAVVDKMNKETPDYVVFNGAVGALTKERAFKAKVGETVRIFFGNAGPNAVSSFHVIGAIFDKVYPEGASEPVTNVQSTLVPAGGATIVEFKLRAPGTYLLVDHSLARLQKGALGMIEVEGPENAEVFKSVKLGAGGGGGH